MNRILERHSLMDGPSPDQIDQLERKVRGLPESALLVVVELIEARFFMHQSEFGLPNEHLQRNEGRKQELKDLKDSIVSARAEQAEELDGEYTNAME